MNTSVRELDYNEDIRGLFIKHAQTSVRSPERLDLEDRIKRHMPGNISDISFYTLFDLSKCNILFSLIDLLREKQNEGVPVEHHPSNEGLAFRCGLWLIDLSFDSQMDLKMMIAEIDSVSYVNGSYGRHVNYGYKGSLLLIAYNNYWRLQFNNEYVKGLFERFILFAAPHMNALKNNGLKVRYLDEE